MVEGSLEDEHVFFIMNLVRSGTRRLREKHLHVAVHIKAQKVFDVKAFPLRNDLRARDASAP